MSLRFHEIAEAGLRLHNPLTEDKLMLLGEICKLREGMRLLDLACGKGELLCQWVQRYGVMGVGVDQHSALIDQAKRRAFELEISNRVSFVVDDPHSYPEAHHQFDVVSSVGFLPMGGSLSSRLHLMRQALKAENSLLLIGEPFWKARPDPQSAAEMGLTSAAFPTLGGLLSALEAAGFELHEMVLTDADSWDRYEAQQWMNVRRFLEAHPQDPDADALRGWVAQNRHTYLNYGRRYMDWGVFVLSAVQASHQAPPLYINPDAPIGAEVADEMLWVRLHDGRIIANPIKWYPWLAQASAQDRAEISLNNLSLEWPSLGAMIEISAMVRGRRGD